jgi:hypothetical protein
MTTTDVLDSDGNNATASYLLKDHHAVVGERESDGHLDNCERCGFAAGWVQPTPLGPDEWGHSTSADSATVRRWIADADSGGMGEPLRA